MGTMAATPPALCARFGTASLWLASRSPRRLRLLGEAGLHPQIVPSDLDDADLRPGRVSPEEWVMALAFFKARRAWELARLDHRRGPSGAAIILGADTLCVHGDEILGQPRHESDARRMIHAMRDNVHRTITGVCLLHVPTGRRMLAVDAATVTVGSVPDEIVDAYVAGHEWRGKAGAYNLVERQAAGWPIVCEGDPSTVMGLPMRKLPSWLERFSRGGA